MRLRLAISTLAGALQQQQAAGRPAAARRYATAVARRKQTETTSSWQLCGRPLSTVASRQLYAVV